MQDGLTLMPIILHPQSIGTVRLHSSDPHDPPLIDPRFLAAEADVKTAISGNILTPLVTDVARLAYIIVHLQVIVL